MRSREDSYTRARSLYEKPVTPRRTQQMLGLLDESTAETAALTATTVLCEYLNRWNEAGQDRVARAEAAVEQALARDASHFMAHYAKGFLHRSRGQHQAALNAFEETIKCAPEFARAYAQKGEQLLYLGRFEDAIAAVQRAIELSPKSAVRGYFYWVIGRAHFFLGRDADAISWLQRSVRSWPNVWYNRLYLVSANAHAGKRAAATRVLQSFHRQFRGYTLARVIENEDATPADHPLVVAGRERFHDGLRRAGLAPR
jgi:adenylate cyclase